MKASHLLLVLSVVFSVCFGVSQLLAAEKNIVLFVSDDHGCDAGCYGNPVIKTPAMDALAADGTLFIHAFCTTASCSASRSVILSGMHNHANGQYGHQHHYHHFSSFPKVKTLPVMLTEAGYRTARIGKYHVAPEEVYKFETVLKGPTRNGVQMAENCREFLAAEDERPFFLYFCTSDPHRGGGRLEELPGRPDRFGNTTKGYPGVEEVTYTMDEVIVPPFLPDTPACRAELTQYYQSVSRVDQGIARLVKILKETGNWDNTLFVYISDHGIAFPGGKTTTYEPGLHSPCIARNPYMKKRGVKCNALVSWVDLTPTLLDFAGATPKKPMYHGRSFLSMFDEENPQGWDEVCASHTFHEITLYYPMRVVRGRQYKLIWNIAHGLPYPFASDLWASSTFQDRYQQGPDTLYGKRTIDAYIHRPAFELYDLKADPDEVNNLAADPQYAEVLEKLQGKIKAMQQKTNDPWVHKWEYE